MQLDKIVSFYHDQNKLLAEENMTRSDCFLCAECGDFWELIFSVILFEILVVIKMSYC